VIAVWTLLNVAVLQVRLSAVSVKRKKKEGWVLEYVKPRSEEANYKCNNCGKTPTKQEIDHFNVRQIEQTPHFIKPDPKAGPKEGPDLYIRRGKVIFDPLLPRLHPNHFVRFWYHFYMAENEGALSHFKDQAKHLLEARRIVKILLPPSSRLIHVLSIVYHFFEHHREFTDSHQFEEIKNELDQIFALCYGPKVHRCDLCEEPASQKCSRCGKVFYCSRDCQANSWKLHKLVCVPKA